MVVSFVGFVSGVVVVFVIFVGVDANVVEIVDAFVGVVANFIGNSFVDKLPTRQRRLIFYVTTPEKTFRCGTDRRERTRKRASTLRRRRGGRTVLAVDRREDRDLCKSGELMMGEYLLFTAAAVGTLPFSPFNVVLGGWRL